MTGNRTLRPGPGLRSRSHRSWPGTRRPWLQVRALDADPGHDVVMCLASIDPAFLAGCSVVEIGIRQAWPYVTFARSEPGAGPEEVRLYVGSAFSVDSAEPALGGSENDSPEQGLLRLLRVLNLTVEQATATDDATHRRPRQPSNYRGLRTPPARAGELGSGPTMLSCAAGSGSCGGWSSALRRCCTGGELGVAGECVLAAGRFACTVRGLGFDDGFVQGDVDAEHEQSGDDGSAD